MMVISMFREIVMPMILARALVAAEDAYGVTHGSLRAAIEEALYGDKAWTPNRWSHVEREVSRAFRHRYSGVHWTAYVEHGRPAAAAARCCVGLSRDFLYVERQAAWIEGEWRFHQRVHPHAAKELIGRQAAIFHKIAAVTNDQLA